MVTNTRVYLALSWPILSFSISLLIKRFSLVLCGKMAQGLKTSLLLRYT